jgi:formylglycine-generating enzyme required for sulfatase activity/tRNA A-37 threonylcarbamoyl transferase component Bud32
MADPNTTISPDDGDGFLNRLRLSIPGYKLLRTLSHGGQGIVYKAIQEKTGKTVAVKVLREGPWADETARQRLEREAKVLASLDHPNIVTMVDSGQTPDGHEFLVMNFIEGMPLDQFFKENKTPADPARMLEIFLKICRAITAAHLAGITHRDLSPSNILIDGNQEPHILDFGLARTAFDRFMIVGPRQISVTGQFLGKVAYASPEQARGEAVDIRTDVYALGVILYQILTGGSYPYQVVGSIAEVLNNIIHAPPTPPSKLLEARDAESLQNRRKLRKRHPPAVNAVIEAIVLKALEKDANQRYQSAGELGRDVQNYLEGLPTVARPAETGSADGFRRYGKYIAAAVLLCAIGGAVAFGMRAWRVRGLQPSVAVAQAEIPTTVPATDPIAAKDTPVAPPVLAENNPPSEIQPITTPISSGDLKPGQIWTNSIGMKLAYIPPGTFEMGSPPNEEGRRQNETLHKVTLTKSLYIDENDVTVGQFSNFVNQSGYQTDAERKGFSKRWDGHAWLILKGLSWRNPGFIQEDDYPVVQVSWNDAMAFCGWLSKLGEKNYRLPTEAEWEYSCRAGSRGAFNTGDGVAALEEAAWCDTNSGNSPHPVGRKKANAWGLYDMHGNVLQWCSDLGMRVPDYLPKDVTDPNGPLDGWSHITRGGEWDFPPARCRSASRADQRTDLQTASLGFRVVVNANEVQRGGQEQNASFSAVQNSHQSNAGSLSPPDTTAFADHHYKFFPQPLGWTDAKKRCEQMGGRLAIVDTPAVQAFLQNLKGENMTAWVGGSFQTESGDWEWLDGKSIDGGRISQPAPAGSDYLFLSHSGNLAPRPESGVVEGVRLRMVQGFICQWDR